MNTEDLKQLLFLFLSCEAVQMSAISSKPFASISSVTLAYIYVVLMFVCPSIRLTTSMRIPCASALVVANVWRAM